jgi:hypothetical protein
MSETIAVHDHLYDVTGQITKTVDFGVRLETSRRTPTPPEGLRFDFHWHAEATGPKLKGKMEGTTYAYTRADGLTSVEWRAVLVTPEGDRIAVQADAVSTRQGESPVFQQRESIRFHTASPNYSWVNRISGIGLNKIDLSTGRFEMKGYEA